MTTQDSRPVTTKVAGVTETGITIHVPWQKPEYPMPIDRFPKRADGSQITAADFKVGEVLVFHLQRGNKKKRKDGGEYDGTKDFHFYWNLVKVERPGSVAQRPAQTPESTELAPGPASEAPRPVPATPRVYDPDAAEKRKRDDIFRSVALQQAVAAVEWKDAEEDDTRAARVRMMAQVFYETLLALHAPETEAQP